MTNAPHLHVPYEGEGLEGLIDPCTSLDDAIKSAKKSIRSLGFKFKKHYSYGIYGVNVDGYYICKTYVPFLFSRILGDLQFEYNHIPWPWVSQHPGRWIVEVYGDKELARVFEEVFRPVSEKIGCELNMRQSPNMKYRTLLNSLADTLEFMMEVGDSAEAH